MTCDLSITHFYLASSVPGEEGLTHAHLLPINYPFVCGVDVVVVVVCGSERERKEEGRREGKKRLKKRSDHPQDKRAFGSMVCSFFFLFPPSHLSLLPSLCGILWKFCVFSTRSCIFFGTTLCPFPLLLCACRFLYFDFPLAHVFFFGTTWSPFPLLLCVCM